MDLSREVGRALRRARETRGLTLREAATASRDRFSPSSIAGYERGERAITVQRFCDLAETYGTDPARLLDGILREARSRPTIEVRLSTLGEVGRPETAAVEDFARRVAELRHEDAADRITLRYADIEVLATAAGHETAELIEMIESARRPPR
jgi:transcriptional regulator with XRE-family HTH domain